MLSYVMLCYVMPCYVLFCSVMLCYLMLCYGMVWYGMVWYVMYVCMYVRTYVCMYVSECDTRDCHINSNMSGYLIEDLGSGRPRYEVVAGRCSAITRHSAPGPGKKDNPSSKVGGTVVNVTCDCQTVPVTCPETPITLILGIFAGGIVGGALMSGASIMDISGKLKTDGIGAVEVECYCNIKAGTHVLLWYDDDDVWHETLVMFVIGGEEVILYPPDHDLHIEKIGCKGIDGPSKLRGLTARGTLPRNLRGRAYRFRVQPTETELRSVFRQATTIAEEERRMTDLPEEIIDHTGAVRSLDEFFGGHFVRHRKSLGVSPAHGDVNSPKNAQFAHGDNVWVAAEPLGGLALGQEVSLNRETDVQCGDKTALALRQGQWVKVELIRVEDAADYSDKRRRLYGFSSPGSSHEPPPGDRAAPKKGVIEDESTIKSTNNLDCSVSSIRDGSSATFNSEGIHRIAR